jgi:catechol 2,3-dioxygenase-like lactoylglutathione lyase family enzyme
VIRHFDHVTIVVDDEAEARRFFAVLGFVEEMTTVIEGERFADYMGVPGISARHVTLVAEGVTPRTEVQLLKYLHPADRPDPAIRDLSKVGFNHVCYAVDDIAATVKAMEDAGFKTRAGVLDFHARKLVYLWGPGGVTIELSEWYAA